MDRWLVIGIFMMGAAAGTIFKAIWHSAKAHGSGYAKHAQVRHPDQEMVQQTLSAKDVHTLNNKMAIVLGRCDLLREQFADNTYLIKQVHDLQVAAQFVVGRLDELKEKSRSARVGSEPG